MSTSPITTIDWTPWAQVPLALLTELPKGETHPRNMAWSSAEPGWKVFGYALLLQPGQIYQFDIGSGLSKGQAYMSLGDTGRLLWANAPALSSLGLDTDLADRLITVDDYTWVNVILTAPARDWQAESFTLDVRQQATDENIYRFVKLDSGQYFYTASSAERELIQTDPAYDNFRFEGPVFSGDASPRDGYEPVYRFADLRTGSYFFTASEDERAELQAAKSDVFRFEGAAFYVPDGETDGVLPVYRMVNPDTGGYLFTTNEVERAWALFNDWVDDKGTEQGVAFYAFPTLAEDATGDTAAADPSAPDADAALDVALLGVADAGPAWDGLAL